MFRSKHDLHDLQWDSLKDELAIRKATFFIMIYKRTEIWKI